MSYPSTIRLSFVIDGMTLSALSQAALDACVADYLAYRRIAVAA